MPRTKEQFEEMRQATKYKIQDAASYLFAKKGIAGTNVQEIADRAGISIGLLYRHYKTKEELFSDLVNMAITGLSETTERFLSDADPKEILTEMTAEIVEDYKKNDEFSNYLTFITQAFTSGLQNDALDRLIAEDKKLIAALAALIERGQRNDAFRSGNSHELAITYMSTIQGIGLFQNVLGADFVVPSVDTLLGIFLSG
ncbi:TetR family transcriptional regulator [Mobilisporobacter senegalensis]|uniref:TetR family transcriptional regulator n=1 Tax=Mobilisporobacter senegalensis TaxID=1329262 RepID=A0A3N1XT79_9FIRM|nr:TetR/AcrR family transcriptional regulator [Mobilisporobacter senegalensis]ROR28067.1 TetR family transcriptional regulator [Mobilisporobacter senegalensis]